jgi:hypothetical protein
VARLEKILFFLLLLLLPSQLGYHFWPAWSLVNGVRVDYLSPTIYFTDLLIGALFVLRRRIFIKPQVLWLIILVAGVNISTAISGPLASYKWLRFLEYLWLGHFIYYVYSKNEEIFRKGLMGAMVWTTGLAMGQFVWQRSLGGFWYWLGERSFDVTTPGISKVSVAGQLWLRPYATLPHPNALAAFLLVSLICLLAILKEKKSMNGWLVIAGAGILLSFSRSTLIGFLALLVYLSWPKATTRFRKLGFAILVILGCGLVPFWPHNPDSSIERLALAKSAVRIFEKQPLIGVGLGNFVLGNSQTPLASQDFKLSLQPVHNIYLLILAETGLVGGLIVVLLVSKTCKWTNLPRQWRLGLLIILGLGLVDHYWLTLHQTALLAAIFLGLIVLKSHDEYGKNIL